MRALGAQHTLKGRHTRARQVNCAVQVLRPTTSQPRSSHPHVKSGLSRGEGGGGGPHTRQRSDPGHGREGAPHTHTQVSSWYAPCRLQIFKAAKPPELCGCSGIAKEAGGKQMLGRYGKTQQGCRAGRWSGCTRTTQQSPPSSWSKGVLRHAIQTTCPGCERAANMLPRNMRGGVSHGTGAGAGTGPGHQAPAVHTHTARAVCSGGAPPSWRLCSCAKQAGWQRQGGAPCPSAKSKGACWAAPPTIDHTARPGMCAREDDAAATALHKPTASLTCANWHLFLPAHTHRAIERRDG